MDALTLSQIIFNTLASLVIILLGVMLGLVIYCIVKITKWMHKIEENISKSSEKINSFFTTAKDSFVVPIISRIFESKKKRKKG